MKKRGDDHDLLGRLALLLIISNNQQNLIVYTTPLFYFLLTKVSYKKMTLAFFVR